MRKLFTFVLLAAVLSPAQNTPTPQDATASMLRLLLQQPPNKVSFAQTQLVGNPGPRTLYYWVVTNNTAGASSPAGPFAITSAPNSLSVSNGVTLSWLNVAGASSYDVLRTSTPAAPSGACNCAVATAVSGSSTTDQSDSLNSYTLSTLDPASLTYTLTNEAQSSGVSHVLLRRAATLIADLSITSGVSPCPLTGADAGAKIAAAVALLPSTGGTIDATCFEATSSPTVSSTLTISKNGVTLRLGAYVLTFATGAQILANGDDFTLQGLFDATVLDGKAETGTVQTIRTTGLRPKLFNFKVQGSRALGGGSGAAVSVQVAGGTDALLHDLTVTKSGSHAIMSIGSSNFRAYNNKLTDNGGSCIWTEGDRDGEWTEDNWCEQPAQTTLTQAGGIHIKAGTTRNVTDIHVIRNHIINAGSTGIVSNATSFRSQNVEIMGNTVDTTGTRSLASGIPGEGMTLTGDNLKVDSNYVCNSYVQGISMWGSINGGHANGNIICNSSAGSGGHAGLEFIATTNDTSGDGQIRNFTVDGLFAYDTQGTPTQLRPVRIYTDTGGTYGNNNKIGNVTGLTNINTNIDFGGFDTSWLMMGSQPGTPLIWNINNGLVLSGDITPPQITSNQNNYDPTGWVSSLVLRLSTDASRQITGLNRGQDGRLAIMQNVGSFAIVLVNESASSSAANRFTLPTDTTISPSETLILQYDSTTSRWRPLFSQVPFSATDAAVDLASVANGACTAERTVAVTGAIFGYPVDVTAGTALEAGTQLFGKVTSAGNTKWQFCNWSGGAVDRASDTYTIRVRK